MLHSFYRTRRLFHPKAPTPPPPGLPVCLCHTDTGLWRIPFLSCVRFPGSVKNLGVRDVPYKTATLPRVNQSINVSYFFPVETRLYVVRKAMEGSITSSSSAEVWKVDPSDGSLFVVTRRLPGPMESLRGRHAKQQQAKRRSCRQLKVEVTAAELSPAVAGRYADRGWHHPYTLWPPLLSPKTSFPRTFFLLTVDQEEGTDMFLPPIAQNKQTACTCESRQSCTLWPIPSTSYLPCSSVPYAPCAPCTKHAHPYDF